MVNDSPDFEPLTPTSLSLALDSFDPFNEVDEISWLHRYLSCQITSFLFMRSPASIRNLVYNLVSTLKDSQFKSVLFQALSRFIKKHPYDAAFVVVAAVLAAADKVVYTPSGATGVIVQGWKASAGGVDAAVASVELLQGGGLAVGVPGSSLVEEERSTFRGEPTTLPGIIGPEELAAGGGRFKAWL